MAKKKTIRPMGFLSYTHFDDANDDGWITDFCTRLSMEVQAQTGSRFVIFQDRNDVGWGQNWRGRIDAGLAAATFFFPVLTPSYLNSKECKRELREFMAWQTKRSRDDLLLPLYYIQCKDRVKKSKLKYIRSISRHNPADWTELRFEPLNERKVRKALAELAIQIRDAIAR